MMAERTDSSLLMQILSIGFFAKFAKLFLQLSIGKYLDDRLLIEQLEVNSRDWTGKLSQVKLNVNVLNNEFLDSQPIRIVEVVIPELTVLLSIKESCKALIHGVTIIVEKNVNYKKKRKTKRSTEGGDAVEEEDGIPIGPTAGTSSFVAEEEQEAAFLMDESNSIIDNMLREVYAKLQVECRNIKVVYHHHHQSSLKAPQISPSPVKWLEFTVAKLVCTNSDVSHSSSGRNLASTFATASPGGALSDTQASLFSFDYYSTKVVTISGIALDICFNDKGSPPSHSVHGRDVVERIFNCDDEVEVKLRLDQTDQLEVNVKIAQIDLLVRLERIAAVLDLVTDVSGAFSDSNASKSSRANKKSSATTGAGISSSRSGSKKVADAELDMAMRMISMEKQGDGDKGKRKPSSSSSAFNLTAEAEKLDYENVARLMEMYKKARLEFDNTGASGSSASGSSALAGDNGAVSSRSARLVDSDGDDDEDDDEDDDDDSFSESQFYDAIDKKPVDVIRLGKSRLKQSRMQGSSHEGEYGKKSSASKKTERLREIDPHQYNPHASNFLRLGVSIDVLSITVSCVETIRVSPSIADVAQEFSLLICKTEMSMLRCTAKPPVSPVRQKTDQGSSSSSSSQNSALPQQLLPEDRMKGNDIFFSSSKLVCGCKVVELHGQSCKVYYDSMKEHTVGGGVETDMVGVAADCHEDEASSLNIAPSDSSSHSPVFRYRRGEVYNRVCILTCCSEITAKTIIPPQHLKIELERFTAFDLPEKILYGLPPLATSASTEAFAATSGGGGGHTSSLKNIVTKAGDQSSLSVIVSFQPVAVSINIDYFVDFNVKITKALSSLVIPTPEEEECTMASTCSIQMPCVEVFLHSIPSTDAAVWDNLLKAIEFAGVDANIDEPWSLLAVPSANSPLAGTGAGGRYSRHLTETTRAGLKIKLTNLAIDASTTPVASYGGVNLPSSSRINIGSGGTASDDTKRGTVNTGISTSSIEMDDLELSLFLKVDDRAVYGGRSQFKDAADTDMAYFAHAMLLHASSNCSSSSNASGSSSSDHLVQKVVISRDSTHGSNRKAREVIGAIVDKSQLDIASSAMQMMREEHGRKKKYSGETTVDNIDHDIETSSDDDEDEDDNDGASSDSDPFVIVSRELSNTKVAISPLESSSIRDRLGPEAPYVDASSHIYICAYMIDFHLRQREFNTLMAIADTVVTPTDLNAADASTADSAATSGAQNSGGSGGKANTSFALIFNTAFALLTVCEDAATLFNFPELESLVTSSTKVPADQPGCVCISIRQPTIELFSVPTDFYLSVKADDLSMYEMTVPQYEHLVQSNFDFNRATGREARYGEGKYKTPFIHRASLHSKHLSHQMRSSAHKQQGGDDDFGAYKFNSYSSLLMGDEKFYDHAFEVKLLLSTAPSSHEDEISPKSVHFFIDFNDIMMTHDPASTWLVKIVKILSPQTTLQMMENKRLQMYQQLAKAYSRLSPQQKATIETNALLDKYGLTDIANMLNGGGETSPQPAAARPSKPDLSASTDGNSKKTIVKLPFEVTKIAVRVRDCLIDYCAPGVGSRSLFSIGMVSVSSTIVSNTIRFALKIKMRGLALHISNHLPPLGFSSKGFDKNGVFSLPLFFQQNSFVQLMTIDQIDNLVTFNGDALEDLLLGIDIGKASINACVDSLQLFVATMQEWFLEFQAAMAKIEVDSIPTAAQSQPLSESTMYCQSVNLGTGHTPAMLYPNAASNGGAIDLHASLMRPPKPVQYVSEPQDEVDDNHNDNYDNSGNNVNRAKGEGGGGGGEIVVPDDVLREKSDELSSGSGYDCLVGDSQDRNLSSRTAAAGGAAAQHLSLTAVAPLTVVSTDSGDDAPGGFHLGTALKENFYQDPSIPADAQSPEQRNDGITALLQSQLDSLDFPSEGVKYKPFYDYDGDLPEGSTACNSLSNSRADAASSGRPIDLDEEEDADEDEAVATGVGIDNDGSENLAFSEHVSAGNKHDLEDAQPPSISAFSKQVTSDDDEGAGGMSDDSVVQSDDDDDDAMTTTGKLSSRARKRSKAPFEDLSDSNYDRFESSVLPQLRNKQQSDQSGSNDLGASTFGLASFFQTANKVPSEIELENMGATHCSDGGADDEDSAGEGVTDAKRLLQTSWMEFVQSPDTADVITMDTEKRPVDPEPVAEHRALLTASDDGFEDGGDDSRHEPAIALNEGDAKKGGGGNGVVGEDDEEVEEDYAEARRSVHSSASGGASSSPPLPSTVTNNSLASSKPGGVNIFNHSSSGGGIISVASEALTEQDRAAMDDHDRAWADNDFDDDVLVALRGSQLSAAPAVIPVVRHEQYHHHPQQQQQQTRVKTFMTPKYATGGSHNMMQAHTPIHQSSQSMATVGGAKRAAVVSGRGGNAAATGRGLEKSRPKKVELQQAKWLVNSDDIQINPDYIPVASHSYDNFDENRPDSERSLLSTVVVKLTGSFEVRLFGGFDWASAKTSQSSKISRNKKSSPISTAEGKSAQIQKNEPTVDGSSSSKRAGRGGKSVQFSTTTMNHDDDGAAAAGIGGRRKVRGEQQDGRHARAGRSSPRLKSREDKDMLALSTKDIYMCMRVYKPQDRRGRSRGATTTGHTFMVESHMFDPSSGAPLLRSTHNASSSAVAGEGVGLGASAADNDSSERHLLQPAQRVVFVAKQLVLSFGKAGQPRKKVLGLWTAPHRPMAMQRPMIQISFVGYNTEDKDSGPIPIMNVSGGDDSEEQLDIEHRMYVQLQPIVSYLDENVVQFFKQIGEAFAASAPPATPVVSVETGTTASSSAAQKMKKQNDKKSKAAAAMYFQFVAMAAIQMRVSYTASIIDVLALRQGDYTQLLNIFPLDGLELTLKQVKQTGISGIDAVFARIFKAWIEDIYANQMMRVLSGTAALKGISHIGHDLKDLLYVPLKDYKKTGGLAKNFMKCSSKLLRTVLSEGLQPIQYITKFVADAISDLVSDSPEPYPASAEYHGKGDNTTTSGSGRRRGPSNATAGSSSVPPINPGNLGEGLKLAYGSLSREMGAAAELVIAVPVREYQQGGARGSAKSLVRALPVAVLRPIAGVSEGISYTIMGLRNNIDPVVRHEGGDLYEVNIWEDGPHSPPPHYKYSNPRGSSSSSSSGGGRKSGHGSGGGGSRRSGQSGDSISRAASSQSTGPSSSSSRNTPSAY